MRESLTSARQFLKSWLYRIGVILGMIGLVFVGLKLYEYQDKIGLQKFTALDYAAMAGLAALYGASNLFLALAWHNLLAALNAEKTLRWAVWVSAVTQIAKYVPGNVFQFAGRQAIGLAAGIRGWPLAKSTAWELTLMSVSSAVSAVLVLPLLDVSVSRVTAVTLFTTAALALVLCARKLWNARAAVAVVCYFAFLLTSGLVFSGALAIAAGPTGAIGYALPDVVGIYILAWLCGLLTPGSPAGIGVREAVLLFLLSQVGNPPTILLAVLVGRAITVTGDLLFFSSSYLIRTSNGRASV